MVREGGMSKAEVGRRLGINDNLIGRWVKEFVADGVVAFPGNGKLKPDDEERRRRIPRFAKRNFGQLMPMSAPRTFRGSLRV
jgi:transposase-like protein